VTSRASTASSEQQRAELHALRAFQASLLPRELSCCGTVEAVAAFKPAAGEMLGGDFYDTVQVEGGTILLIGDVTGHGTPAALVMALAWGSIRGALPYTRRPCELLGHLHELLEERGREAGGPRLFSATVFIAFLGEDGRLAHASAGHPPPLLLRPGQEPLALSAESPPLGFVAPESCGEDSVQLQRGDRLVLYTDGVFESAGGMDGLCGKLCDLDDATPRQVVDALVEPTHWDDQTAMVVKYLGL
jgi:serine phosphatase RsbU (regulator of sigma subunit)